MPPADLTPSGVRVPGALPAIPALVPSPVTARQWSTLYQRFRSSPPLEVSPRFEAGLSRLFGSLPVTTFGSWLAAWRALWEALAYPRGSRVLLPSLIAPGIARTVREAGLEVVWVPMRISDLSLNTRGLRAGDLDRTRALVMSHCYGYPAAAGRLRRFCQTHNLDLIEDLHDAAGARIGGRSVGTFGRAAVLSLESDQTLSCWGGGAVLAGDQQTGWRLRGIRDHLPNLSPGRGWLRALRNGTGRLLHSPIGYALWNFPMTYVAGLVGGRNPSDRPCDGDGPMERLSLVRAELGQEALHDWSITRARARQRWGALQDCLIATGMQVDLPAESEAAGFVSVGIHEDADLVAGAFFRYGIPVSWGRRANCPGEGLNRERCEPIAEHLFHLPLRLWATDAHFASYVKTVRGVLRMLAA